MSTKNEKKPFSYKDYYSRIANRTPPSMIRQLLAFTQKEAGIISFAGGLPGYFDTLHIREILDELQKESDEKLKSGLQYGLTGGYLKLVEEEIKLLEKEGIQAERENILNTSGSQQALDIIAKTFLNKDEYVLVPRPTYLGALGAFRQYGPRFVEIESDENGIKPDDLERKIKSFKRMKDLARIKFLYVVPDFNNPTGTTIAKERREEIIEICKKYDVIIIEDSPYKKLRYDGKEEPLFAKLEPDWPGIITLMTFSKIFAPGLRQSFIYCKDTDAVEKFNRIKQNSTLCGSSLDERILAEYLERGFLPTHIENIINDYRPKRDAMLTAMHKYFGGKIEVKKPEGGMFLWPAFPDVDTYKKFPKAIENNVAYVPGRVFYADQKKADKNKARFCFVTETETRIDEGIRRLAEIF